jgi:hypothetical protein
MRIWRLIALVLVMLAPAATASALPGDPPIEQLGPEAGAAVPVTRDGIPVRFTCPSYIISTSGPGLTNYGDYTDYSVDFATSPQLGVNGRLLGTSTVASGAASRSNAGVDQCTSAMFANPIDRVPGPQDTPGTYYWQVNRICGGCPTSDYETSAVRSFRVRAFDLGVKVQRRAFTGYPVILGLRAGGVPNDAKVSVQRRAGNRWKTIASAGVFSESAEAVVILPRGRQRLRLRARVGDEIRLSAVRTVRVSRARSWSTTRADDGRYTGRAESSKISLRVARGGRVIRDFRSTVTALCLGPTVEQNRIAVLLAPLGKARIAPDGRFFAAARAGQATDVTIRGRLRRGRIRGGQVEVTLSTCTGSADFRARRAGG